MKASTTWTQEGVIRLNNPSVALAQAAVAIQKVLAGGMIDRAVKTETEIGANREVAGISVKRWAILFNTGSFEQFVELGKAGGIPVANQPDKAQVAVRRTPDGTFLLIKPCPVGEEGLQVTLAKGKRPPSVPKLHLFLKRNKVAPGPRTIFSSPTEIGSDKDFGTCLIADMTTPEIRMVEKRAKKNAEGSTDAPASTAPAAAQAPAPATASGQPTQPAKQGEA